MNDLQLKPSDAVDLSKCKTVIRRNWRDSNSDSDAESLIQIYVSGAGSPRLT